jgi:hypothetical protein
MASRMDVYGTPAIIASWTTPIVPATSTPKGENPRMWSLVESTNSLRLSTVGSFSTNPFARCAPLEWRIARRNQEIILEATSPVGPPHIS